MLPSYISLTVLELISGILGKTPEKFQAILRKNWSTLDY